MRLTDSIARPDAGSAYRPGDTAVLQKDVQRIILDVAEPLERASRRRCPLPSNNKTDVDQ
jgi:hypothetical protein